MIDGVSFCDLFLRSGTWHDSCPQLDIDVKRMDQAFFGDGVDDEDDGRM